MNIDPAIGFAICVAIVFAGWAAFLVAARLRE
jgi:hypothetical protein